MQSGLYEINSFIKNWKYVPTLTALIKTTSANLIRSLQISYITSRMGYKFKVIRLKPRLIQDVIDVSAIIISQTVAHGIQFIRSELSIL